MTSVRVATYNLYLGADLARLFEVATAGDLVRVVTGVHEQVIATRAEERALAVAVLLARERPDLVGLQEVSRWTVAPSRSDGDTEARRETDAGGRVVLADVLPSLLDALDELACGYDVWALNENLSGAMPLGSGELMTMTVANATLVRRDGPASVVDELTAEFRDGHRALTGMAGLTFPVARSWGRVDVLVDGQPLRFVNTHTEAYDDATRAAQITEVVATNEATSAPVVVVGDLNAEPDDVSMPERWVDAWSEGEGPGHSCCQAAGLLNGTSSLARRIDYVWVRGARVLGAHLAGDQPADRTRPHDLWPSDHACVVADLEL